MDAKIITKGDAFRSPRAIVERSQSGECRAGKICRMKLLRRLLSARKSSAQPSGLNNEPRSTCRSRAANRELVDGDGGEESTQDASLCGRSTEGTSSLWTIPQVPGRRRVAFCEDHNQSYDCPWEKTTPEETAMTWYDASDIATFKSDADICARNIMSQGEEMDPQVHAWSVSLLAVYGCLCSVETAAQGNQMLAASYQESDCQSIEPRLIALEKSAMPEVRTMRIQLRQQMYVEVLQWQNCRGLSDAERARLIRQTCRYWSQPNRLFAVYLGQLVHKS